MQRWLWYWLMCVAMQAGAQSNNVSYSEDVRPLLEKRCIVCHACYDAPCQLKLTSYDGLQRGTSPEKVYSGARPFAIDPQRLFIDAHGIDAWRKRGFTPVVPDDPSTTAAQSSVMHRILTLKKRNPLPLTAFLGDEFDLSLNRDNQCPTPQTFDKYARAQPLAGMPYALPGLNDQEQSILLKWIEHGASNDSTAATLSPALQAKVAKWETLLNGQSLKQQLAARYIYEHWFLGSLHFPELGSKDFFKLVRSATPPGEAIEIIATRRPYDDPEQAKVYYRLWRDPQIRVSKTHMPLALDDAQFQMAKSLLFDANYKVKSLPDYSSKTASNPFRTFSAIPLDSKYRFLLHNAQYTIMGFIKGPVCRGQTALNVVNDRFWVFFVSPQANSHPEFETLLAQQADNLKLPAKSGSNALTLTNWVKYLDNQRDYVKAKQARVNAVVKTSGAIGLDTVWNGEGTNTNAALTVFRHFDSATVERGLIGDIPKTAWLIDYAMLERIHYLLVAGYDVFGNVGHQFNTRVYMDYLRLEGESALLSLLPKDEQQRLIEYWYRDTPAGFGTIVGQKYYSLDIPTDIQYQTGVPYLQLLSMLKNHIGPALDQRYANGINGQTGAMPVNTLPNPAVQQLPQVSFVLVGDTTDWDTAPASTQAFSIVRNNAHSNIAVLFSEGKRHLPEEDSATLVSGFIGDYPNALWYVSKTELDGFLRALAAVKNEIDYQRLRNKYGVRRTHPQFWSYADILHNTAARYKGLEYGVFDFNRLEDR